MIGLTPISSRPNQPRSRSAPPRQTTQHQPEPTGRTTRRNPIHPAAQTPAGSRTTKARLPAGTNRTPHADGQPEDNAPQNVGNQPTTARLPTTNQPNTAPANGCKPGSHIRHSSRRPSQHRPDPVYQPPQHPQPTEPTRRPPNKPPPIKPISTRSPAANQHAPADRLRTGGHTTRPPATNPASAPSPAANRPRPRLGRSTSRTSLGLPDERQPTRGSICRPGAPSAGSARTLGLAGRSAHQAESSGAQRPLGSPPMPSATSSAMEPVGMTSIGARPSSPRRIIELANRVKAGSVNNQPGARP